MHYNIDLNSGTVRAIMTVKDYVYKGRYYYKKTFMGIAKCNPEDTFVEEIGMAIAKKRALLSFYKASLKNDQYRILSMEKALNQFKREHAKRQIKVYDLQDELNNIQNELK